MASGYERTIRHYQPDASTLVGTINNDAVNGCWFELHRQGGCGAGELQLKDGFLARSAIDVGDWISLEYALGDRWYFGRVESREADSPAGIRFRLEGMSIELSEVFPGGFGESADGVPPHRYAKTDLFPNDPDYLLETFDSVDSTTELVKTLINQYVVPATHITLDPRDVEEASNDAGLTSFKFRGEESIRSILKDLALRANQASWGVDETGAFFMKQPVTTIDVTYREGVDLSRLEESRDRDLIFNRVLLTGGYVYDEPVNSFNRARGFYRWRAHYLQPESRDEHGERRIQMWIPWIRTETDSLAFIREFFRIYSGPTSRYFVEVPNRSALLKPWEEKVRLLDRHGAELITSQIETLRVIFDRAPSFRMELGPLDPHTLWPEPPHDERWEVPDGNANGGDISLTSLIFSLSSQSSSLESAVSLTSEESLTSSEELTSTIEPNSTLEPTSTLVSSLSLMTESSVQESISDVVSSSEGQESSIGQQTNSEASSLLESSFVEESSAAVESSVVEDFSGSDSPSVIEESHLTEEFSSESSSVFESHLPEESTFSDSSFL